MTSISENSPQSAATAGGPMLPLQGRRIVMGVTAGIAAYKAAHIVRSLSELGADVRVIPTPASLEFVGPATWEALSHNPVTTSVFEEVSSVAHVRLGHEADLVVVAPATADFLARARLGQSDDLLTSTLLVARCPVIIAPAMHTEMWQHPATQDNVRVLRERGVHVLEPATGRLTGRDSGPGRLPDPAAITAAAVSALAVQHPIQDSVARSIDQDLAGAHVVITAGGTRERIDPVRVLTNHSSGKQGYALAHAALLRGARVTLITASESMPAPAGAAVIPVRTASELGDAVDTHADAADVLIMAAAVSDFTADEVASKIKKDSSNTLQMRLNATRDILATTVERSRAGRGPRVIVGFAAETGDQTSSALEYAQRKARSKKAMLLAFNDLTHHDFGSDTNHVTLLDSEGRSVREIGGTKDVVAHGILHEVARILDDCGALLRQGKHDDTREGT